MHIRRHPKQPLVFRFFRFPPWQYPHTIIIFPNNLTCLIFLSHQMIIFLPAWRGVWWDNPGRQGGEGRLFLKNGIFRFIIIWSQFIVWFVPKLAWQHIIRLSFEVRATVTFEDGKIVCVQKAKKEGQKSTRVINCCICICCIAITRWTKMTNSFFRTELELFSVTFFSFFSPRGRWMGLMRWSTQWPSVSFLFWWWWGGDGVLMVIVMVMEFNGDGDRVFDGDIDGDWI